MIWAVATGARMELRFANRQRVCIYAVAMCICNARFYRSWDLGGPIQVIWLAFMELSTLQNQIRLSGRGQS
jgi:hypothetical protein